MRVETPLYRSTSDSVAIVHSPTPQRVIPFIKAPESPAPYPDAESSGLLAIEQSRQGWHEDHILNVSTIKQPRSASPQHHKDPGPNLLPVNTAHQGLHDTSDKSPSIAKIRPSPFAHLHGTRGHCVRHGRKLGQLQDPKVQGEVCPDCIAELTIRNRERSERNQRRRDQLDAAANAAAGATGKG